MGDKFCYEFGLQHEDQDVKIEIKCVISSKPSVKITIDGTEYDSKKMYTDLTQTPF